jgi:hypothetical protein
MLRIFMASVPLVRWLLLALITRRPGPCWLRRNTVVIEFGHEPKHPRLDVETERLTSHRRDHIAVSPAGLTLLENG